jgi:DNA-directed RNA polymerase subunit M/transcription elongation factor TFIIS
MIGGDEVLSEYFITSDYDSDYPLYRIASLKLFQSTLRSKNITQHELDLIIENVEMCCWDAAMIKAKRIPQFNESEFYNTVDSTSEIIFREQYSYTVSTVVSYIKDTRYYKLRISIIAKENLTTKFTETDHDIDEDRKMEIAEMKQLALKSGKIKRDVTNAYRCRECGENSATYLKLQIRSADEGQSLELTCENCHSIWIVHG